MNIPSTPEQQGHEHSTSFSREKPPQLHFPGSRRGYRHGTIFETFMLRSREGAKCLEDVRHLHGEPALAGLTGFRSLPCAATLGGWLQRVGRSQPSRD
ncbi:MAG: hypothetical protein OXF20_09270, partial [Gammaproteobacteria bacterium]|nr:hypothetical protein [Gammaproteobacteria bacterium]